ncbi:permease [Anaerocolumna cellulosilytica]|uniref:Permease n=1 Tax=Anaerocolumna cellulosilytica TaxID=433286 RepID=A0A6S6QWF2_9FIRM|nr:EamA family transporter [Anaerocolumna cellulosilytica]MBB5194444.1 drug/metabolite transporter (DMT)-like permease [Anaerocolumna cellulosilytica]BCJ93389.1 permease [Anaerocolumna cellulosilytica]
MNILILSILIFIMTVSGTFGALFFKRAINGNDEKIQLIKLILSPYLYIGGASYLLGAFLNIYLLRFMDYSILYPMTSLTYIWTMIVSYKVLGEKMNKYKILAVFFIIAGIIILNIM